MGLGLGVTGWEWSTIVDNTCTPSKCREKEKENNGNRRFFPCNTGACGTGWGLEVKSLAIYNIFTSMLCNIETISYYLTIQSFDIMSFSLWGTHLHQTENWSFWTLKAKTEVLSLWIVKVLLYKQGWKHARKDDIGDAQIVANRNGWIKVLIHSQAKSIMNGSGSSKALIIVL